jgi:hypothetical protein
MRNASGYEVTYLTAHVIHLLLDKKYINTNSTSTDCEQKWLSNARNQTISKLVLAFINTYIIGRTATFAADYGYYTLGPVYRSLLESEHL